jgi:Tol biopolymer transport system component/DNA-binding winged helix-turn-helix (wHTH) protein
VRHNWSPLSWFRSGDRLLPIARRGVSAMERLAQPSLKFRFREFEFDARTGELKNAKGKTVRLAQQPAGILLALLERPGDLITREELARRLWPAGTFVDFDRSLNKAINKLREALHDPPEHSRFIETFPRRGYRLIAPVSIEAVDHHNWGEASVHPTAVAVNPSSEPEPAIRRLSASASRGRRRPTALLTVALFVAFALTVGAYRRSRYWHSVSMQHLQLTKLTDIRKVELDAISPDGRYVAYTQRDRDGLGLWVRQLATRSSSVQILPPESVEFSGLTFSPDNTYIYFVRSEKNHPSFRHLYSIPILGGSTKLLLRNVDSPVSFSPDGEQFVFTRGITSRGVVELCIAEADGQREHLLVAMQEAAPFHQSGPAWSPDGRAIAVSVMFVGKQVRWGLETVSMDGSVHELYSSPYKIGRPLWTQNGHALLVALDDQTNQGQLWEISFPGGQPRRLTNDLTDYEDDRIDLTRDGKTAAIIAWDMSGDVWEAPISDLSKAQQLESSALPLLDVTPGPGGRILAAGLDSQLWIMNADGNQRSIFSDHPARAPILCGRFVLFISSTIQWDTDGLMRADADGSNVTKLASGHLGSAVCSPDGKFVFYDNVDHPQKIRRLAVEGGTPIEIADIPTEGHESHLALSPDGKLLAYVYRQPAEPPTSAWKIVVIPVAGGRPIKVYSLPGEIHTMRWSPDGRGLHYTMAIFASGAANIWEQPLAGGEPRRLTTFTSGRTYDFNWSADGKRLLMTRGDLNGDIVLLRVVP